MGLSKELKEAVKDLKVGDKSVLSVIEDINDRAEAKDKVQKANEDLTKQREAWDAEKKELKGKLSELEKTGPALEEARKKIELLEKEKLTPEEREKLKQSDDLKATINALNEKYSTLEESLKSEKDLRLKAEEERKTASVESKKQALRTNLTNELNKHKITDVKNVQALHTIFGEGFAKLHINDDGTTEEKYYTKNSSGELAVSTLPDMVKKFAETNLHLVESSNRTGSGQSHNTTNDSRNHYANLNEEKRAAEALMNQK